MPDLPELLPELKAKLIGKHIVTVILFILNRLQFIDLSEWDSELDATDIENLLDQSLPASAAAPLTTSTPVDEATDGNSIFT